LSDHSEWIKPRHAFFLPVHVLSRVFRGKFVAGLKQAYAAHQLGFHGQLQFLAKPKAFASWIRQLFRQDRVVYAKPPFGGAEHALRYLGNYTHRVAISNHRLVSLANGIVTFRWRDSAHHNKKRLMNLTVEEFLRRFLLHLLPPRFVRIRHFGFLANRKRSALLPLCFHVLGAPPLQSLASLAPLADSRPPIGNCPICGGIMILIQRFTATDGIPRSPPSPSLVTR
jgi:hypothetical protein